MACLLGPNMLNRLRRQWIPCISFVHKHYKLEEFKPTPYCCCLNTNANLSPWNPITIQYHNYTNFEHVGIIRFWVKQTNKQTDGLKIPPTSTYSVSVGNKTVWEAPSESDNNAFRLSKPCCLETGNDSCRQTTRSNASTFAHRQYHQQQNQNQNVNV